tara:strand:- start:37 stop:420 length:384 start_codon:yes stop_codon:yes gene_type:complete
MIKNDSNYYIIKRSNLLDCDGSAFHDSFEIIESFTTLADCKKKFKKILSSIDSENIINKHTVKCSEKSKQNKYNDILTLLSEYRKIEIFKFIENEMIALEIIKTRIDPKKFLIDDGVRNFSGCIYST